MIKMTVDQRCAETLMCLDAYQWDPTKLAQRKTYNIITHLTWQMLYGVCVIFV